MARGIGGLFSQSCSRARRGSFFQCNFFRFDFRSIFGSIQASTKKGIEKGFEEESKLRNSSLLGSDWGDGARGQKIRTNSFNSGIDTFQGRLDLGPGDVDYWLKPLQA